jgi:hypothetical protein
MCPVNDEIDAGFLDAVVPKKRVAFEKAPQNFCLERILKDAKI